jgi:hypothetical protein
MNTILQLKQLIDKYTVETQVKERMLREFEYTAKEQGLDEDTIMKILDIAYSVWLNTKVEFTTETGIGVAMDAFIRDIEYELTELTVKNFEEFYFYQEWR